MTGDTVNLADSSKVQIAKLADELANDPGGFFATMWDKALEFGLKLLAAILIYIIGAWIIRRIRKWLVRRLEKRKAEKTLSSFVISLTTISLTVVLIIITISTLGVNTTSLAALLASAGVAIGMALSGTMQNFAGGLMILFFKPFRVGDYIKAQNYEGFVTDVSVVSTKLRTWDNRDIILPNGALFNGNIENHYQRDVRRIDWKVSVEYGASSDKVIEVLMGIARNQEKIVGSDTPGASDAYVIVNQLQDSSVEYILRAWVKTTDYWGVLYAVNKAIYDELPRNGINFPFPQLDVHMKQ